MALVQPPSRLIAGPAQLFATTEDVAKADAGVEAQPAALLGDAATFITAVCAMVAAPASLSASEFDAVVSPGQSIQAAIDAADPGAVIGIESGAYNETLFVQKSVHLVGFGPTIPELWATPAQIGAAGGKGLIRSGSGTSSPTVTLEGLLLRDALAPDFPNTVYDGIRWQSGVLNLTRCVIQDCDNGVLGNGISALVDSCTFNRCGGDGLTHAFYGVMAAPRISQLRFIGANLFQNTGQRTGEASTNIQSAALVTRVEPGAVFEASFESYHIKVKDGGDLYVDGITATQDELTTNNRSLLLYQRGTGASGVLEVHDCTFIALNGPSNMVALENSDAGTDGVEAGNSYTGFNQDTLGNWGNDLGLNELEWAGLNFTNTLQDVVSPMPVEGTQPIPGILKAWNGGFKVPPDRSVGVGPSGGHRDSSFEGVLLADLELRRWVVKMAAGVPPGVSNADDDYYPVGTPPPAGRWCSRHTYDGMDWVPTIGAQGSIAVMGGSRWGDGGSGSGRLWLYDWATGALTDLGENPGGSFFNGTLTWYQPSGSILGKLVYFYKKGRLYCGSYDLDTGQWTGPFDVGGSSDQYKTSRYAPGTDRILVAGDGQLYEINPNTLALDQSPGYTNVGGAPLFYNDKAPALIDHDDPNKLWAVAPSITSSLIEIDTDAKTFEERATTGLDITSTAWRYATYNGIYKRAQLVQRGGTSYVIYITLHNTDVIGLALP